MANIALNHANIHEAADALQQASASMRSSMDECLQAVASAQHQLQGDLADAAAAFYRILSTNDGQMTDDLNQGAHILRQMHGLLVDADKRAAVPMS
ncbi:hypothetical protein ACWD7F_34135 [Streptomyces sp. NPDC005122]